MRRGSCAYFGGGGAQKLECYETGWLFNIKHLLLPNVHSMSNFQYSSFKDFDVPYYKNNPAPKKLSGSYYFKGQYIYMQSRTFCTLIFFLPQFFIKSSKNLIIRSNNVKAMTSFLNSSFILYTAKTARFALVIS